MVVDQRLQPDVGQNIAAISNERFAAKLLLDVLDSAARVEQHRLIHEGQLAPRVTIFRKRSGKHFREPMGVDENFFDPEVDQVVERERDQRLLKDWDERLWQFFGERPKSRTEPGAEDECLFDHGHGAKTREWARKQSGAGVFRNGKTLDSFFSKCWSRGRS